MINRNIKMNKMLIIFIIPRQKDNHNVIKKL